MAIFGETLGEVRNPRLFWYIVRRNTANHSALLYACVQYSHLRFCSRILYTWVFAIGLMLSSSGAIGEGILFLCFVLYSCTLLVTSRVMIFSIENPLLSFEYYPFGSLYSYPGP